MEWHYIAGGLAAIISIIVAIISVFVGYLRTREQRIEDSIEFREHKIEDSLQLREEKINLRFEMFAKLQAEQGDNCLKGLDDIKDTLKEIKIQINNHTVANTALSIEVERIKSNMDGVVGKVEQMERMFEAVIAASKELSLND